MSSSARTRRAATASPPPPDKPPPKPNAKATLKNPPKINLKDHELADLLADLKIDQPPQVELEAMGVWLHKKIRNNKGLRRKESEQTNAATLFFARQWLDGTITDDIKSPVRALIAERDASKAFRDASLIEKQEAFRARASARLSARLHAPPLTMETRSFTRAMESCDFVRDSMP